MKKHGLALATVTFGIIGFILMNIGFWASNADKDPIYRRRIAPNYDTFISSAQSLQTGTKVAKGDLMFWIYEALLENQDPSLKELGISEISKLDCNGASLTMDGKTHNHCIFDVVLNTEETKQVQITDLQDVINNALLHSPAYRIEKQTFHVGVFLQLLSGLLWLINNEFLVFKFTRRKR